MALHLNLYHEIQNEARARRRDPLKLGIYALVFIALCFVGYYLLRMKQVASVVDELQSTEAEWASLERNETLAIARATELERSIEISKNLVTHVENRFHWAPILEEIGRLVPPAVQVTRFSGDLRAPNQVQITLDGVAAGAQPRTIAEDLRIALGGTLSKRFKGVSSTFVSLDDGTETVLVDGESAPTAVFTIRVEFDPTKPAPAEAAPASEDAAPAPADAAPVEPSTNP